MLPVTVGPAKKVALAKVPYVNLIPEDGRIISLLSYYDEDEKTFKQPFPRGDEMIFLKGKPEQGLYYAKSPVDKDRDIYLKFVDFITRYYSFASAVNTLIGAVRDILNCSAIIEKYFIFLDLYHEKKDALIANLVMTDIEFLFSNVRSIYDSLQVLVKDMLKLCQGHTSKPLPESYAKMVKIDESKLKSKYNLPDPLIKFYVSTRDFFLECRRIRKGFLHQRIDIPVIFSLNEGFALQKNSLFFNDPVTSTFNIWPPEKTKQNNLVSVLSLIAHLNETVIAHTESFSDALNSSLNTPLPITKEYKVFLRGPYTHHLLKSKEYVSLQWIESD